MIHLVTYSADNMTRSREVCVQAAKENGADNVYEYTENMLYGSGDFLKNNRDIITAERGKGFWIWKPFIINHVIRDWCKDGDILIYCDAGVKLINNVSHIIEVMDQDIFLFSNGHNHIHWCKKDVIQAINYEKIVEISRTEQGAGIRVDENYNNYQQVQASVIFFKVNQNTRNFIKEWLLWCQMPGFIDDSPSKLPNHPEFAQHRYDQAILTCLQIKYGYKLHWWADARWYESQRYRWPEDKYPSMFDHHRYRNKGEGKGEIEWP